MLDVREGEVLAGKYRIERVLGEGGMGVVVAAMHLQLDERVAMKFLLPSALNNPDAVTRFAREARAAVKIKSEHVARVSDVGTLENGAPYMVMEYLQGSDLAALIKHSGPLSVAAAAEYVLQACEALAEAHALGIVHRDLKPANLFLVARADGSPCVKVLDFGISKLTSASSSGADYGMTKTQAIMGSPLYMSPEQMSSARSVDARADIWAIGAILYELVTGTVPFEADTMPQLCGMILQEAPLSPRSHRMDVPEGFEQVILRCLEKDRARRFQNVAELAMALAPFVPVNGLRSAQRIAKVLNTTESAPSETRPSGDANQPTVAAANASSATQHNWGKTLSKAGGRAVWVVAALALMGGGGAVALWLRPGDVASPISEPTAPPAASVSQPSAAVFQPNPALPVVETAPSVAPSAPLTSASPSVPSPAKAARPTAPRRLPPSRPGSPTPTAPTQKPAETEAAINPLSGRR